MCAMYSPGRAGDVTAIPDQRTEPGENRQTAQLGPNHRVDRVIGLFSSRSNWDPQTPSPTGEGVPPFGSGGEVTHSIAGEGGGGPNSDEGTTEYTE